MSATSNTISDMPLRAQTPPTPGGIWPLGYCAFCTLCYDKRSGGEQAFVRGLLLTRTLFLNNFMIE